jgi:hypothetical protein
MCIPLLRRSSDWVHPERRPCFDKPSACIKSISCDFKSAKKYLPRNDQQPASINSILRLFKASETVIISTLIRSCREKAGFTFAKRAEFTRQPWENQRFAWVPGCFGYRLSLVRSLSPKGERKMGISEPRHFRDRYRGIVEWQASTKWSIIAIDSTTAPVERSVGFSLQWIVRLEEHTIHWHSESMMFICMSKNYLTEIWWEEWTFLIDYSLRHESSFPLEMVIGQTHIRRDRGDSIEQN